MRDQNGVMLGAAAAVTTKVETPAVSVPSPSSVPAVPAVTQGAEGFALPAEPFRPTIMEQPLAPVAEDVLQPSLTDVMEEQISPVGPFVPTLEELDTAGLLERPLEAELPAMDVPPLPVPTETVQDLLPPDILRPIAPEPPLGPPVVPEWVPGTTPMWLQEEGADALVESQRYLFEQGAEYPNQPVRLIPLTPENLIWGDFIWAEPPADPILPFEAVLDFPGNLIYSPGMMPPTFGR